MIDASGICFKSLCVDLTEKEENYTKSTLKQFVFNVPGFQHTIRCKERSTIYESEFIANLLTQTVAIKRLKKVIT